MLITLTTQQIDRIHEATLRILWETGIVLDHAGAVQRLGGVSLWTMKRWRWS